MNIQQEIFNRAYRGLKAQGFERSLDYEGTCRYRGDNGFKCAIGHCINYEEYFDGLETRVASDEAIEMAVAASLGISEHDYPKIFVSFLQRCHDDGYSPKEMEENLRHFAEVKGLTIPEDA